MSDDVKARGETATPHTLAREDVFFGCFGNAFTLCKCTPTFTGLFLAALRVRHWPEGGCKHYSSSWCGSLELGVSFSSELTPTKWLVSALKFSWYTFGQGFRRWIDSIVGGYTYRGCQFGLGVPVCRPEILWERDVGGNSR